MKNDNVIQTKSYSFAIRVVEVYKYLISETRECISCPDNSIFVNNECICQNGEYMIDDKVLDIIYCGICPDDKIYFNKKIC